MTAAMPRPRLPNLHKEISQYGKLCWYYRVGKGPRVRIRGEFMSAQFVASYEAARDGLTLAVGSSVTAKGTLGWLITRYKDSAAWARLAVHTQSARNNIYRKTPADMPLAMVNKKVIAAGIDRRRDHPFAANDFLKAMRGLFRWAEDAGLVDADPTAGVRGPSQKTEGYHVWTEEEIERFQARWPVGTRECLALSILLYTGLRRGDAAILGRQHIKDGVIALRTGKTGQPVIIPLLPELAEIIDRSPTGDLAFIIGKNGRPMTSGSFGGWFSSACGAAGVPGSAHGLRKAGATRAANNGATVSQLEAIFGWTSGKMASLYTKQADRVRLAREAMGKLRR